MIDLDLGLVWINRGPLRAATPQDKRRRLADLMTAIKRHYTERRSYYLRLAPPVADAALAEEALTASGLVATATPGWASAELDLAPEVDALRRGLRSNWRNTLGKAERGGVAVRSGSDEATFSAFTAAYDHFLTERDFDTTVTPKLLTTLQQLLASDQRLTAFIAERGGELLGAALISRNGGRAEYLSGFVEEPGRALGAGQILLWHAVMAMKATGMKVFDLGGMDPDITPRGIYDFKDGLGGKSYRLGAEREAGGEGLLGRLVRWRVAGARSAA